MEYYNQTMLDFIALESAILNFEVENGLNEFCPPPMNLGGVSGEADSASESTTSDSDFVFGVGLFEEAIATESVYSTEPALEGVGTKIWNTIKAIITAIGNFFKGLFKKTSEASKQIDSNQKAANTASRENIVKKTKVIIDENGNEITEEESRKRTEEIRRKTAADEAEYQKKKASADAHQKDEAKKAERQRQFDEEMNQMDKEREERRQRREKKEKYTAYQEKKHQAEKEANVKAFANETIRYHINEKLKKISYDIVTKAGTFITEIAGCAGVLEKYGLPTVKKISELLEEAKKFSKSGDTKNDIVYNFHNANYNTNGPNAKVLINQAGDIMGDEKTCNKAIDNLNKLKEALTGIYTDAVSSLMNDKYIERFGSEDNVRKVVKANCMQKMYSNTKYLNQLKNVCQKISKACEGNIDFCSKIVKTLDGVDYKKGDTLNNEAKAIFDMCKSYMNISKMYTIVSASVNQIINGSIFN